MAEQATAATSMRCPIADLGAPRDAELELENEFALPSILFAETVRPDILARVVRWQLAKRRAGTHSARTRSQVQGSTRKLFRQKGSGRARMGNRAVVGRRGGGIAFPPQVRSHAHNLPKKMRRLGLRMALLSKQRSGQIIALEASAVPEARTSLIARRLTGLKITSALLVLEGENDGALKMACANLSWVDVLPVAGLNVYDILRREHLLLTRKAVAELEARLQ